jgi:hypothetical protein
MTLVGDSVNPYHLLLLARHRSSLPQYFSLIAGGDRNESQVVDLGPLTIAGLMDRFTDEELSR